MINSQGKYNKLIAYIVLSSYLFLSAATVIHFHSIEILNPYSISADETNQSKFDSSNNGLNCFILQNFISLHTSITSILANNENNTDFTALLIRINKFHKLPSSLSASIYLRAPPISFS